jgi:hypothetical protein
VSLNDACVDAFQVNIMVLNSMMVSLFMFFLKKVLILLGARVDGQQFSRTGSAHKPKPLRKNDVFFIFPICYVKNICPE